MMATTGSIDKGSTEELASLRQRHTELLNGVRTATASHEEFGKHLKDLYLSLEDIPALSKDPQIALANARKTAAAIKNCLRSCEAQAELVWRPTAKSAVKAHQIFIIPELVKLVMDHLDLPDLLQAAQVNRTTAAVVLDTAKFQRALCLQDRNDGLWYSPFADREYIDLQCEVTVDGHLGDALTPQNTGCLSPSNSNFRIESSSNSVVAVVRCSFVTHRCTRWKLTCLAAQTPGRSKGLSMTTHVTGSLS